MSDRYRCIKNYQSPYPESILFRKGEVVVVGEEYEQDPDWRNWIRCQAEDGREAWVPKQYLKINKETGIFLRDYDARELNLAIADVIHIREIVNGFGMAQKQNGDKGWAPMNHLEIYP